MGNLSYRLYKDAVRPRVSALGYRVPDDLTGCGSGTWSLKNRLLGGHADVSVLRDDRFEVSFSTEHYFEGLRYDGYYGFLRLQKQRIGVSQMCNDIKVPVAWVLVSCYYASFFAAVEFLRAMGLWIAFFTPDQMQCIAAQALNPACATLNHGPYVGTATWDKAGDVIKLAYSRRAGAAHQLVWQKIAPRLTSKPVLKTSEDRKELELLARMMGMGSNFWRNPSETRNAWNYQEARLYTGHGEGIGKTLRKLLSNPGSSYKWAQMKGLARSEANEAAALAYMMDVLFEVLDQTKMIILDAKTLAKIAL